MAKNNKILVISNLYPTENDPGTPSIKDQVVALTEMGVQIDVLRIDRNNKLNYFKILWQVFQLNFEPKKYDLIHAFYGHCGFIARFQWKYPVVVTYLGSDILSGRDGVLGRFVAKLIDAVIVMTQEMKQLSGRRDACVIPFGVNTHIFRPYEYLQTRIELGLDLHKSYMLFPYDPKRKEKRFDLILETLKILQEAGHDVEPLVVFNESHQMVAKYMSAADGFILASDHEGSPVAIREALACCLPIVAVDVGDVKDLISNLERCYVVERTPASMAEAFEKIILSKKRIENCNSSSIDTNYSARQVFDVYHSVLQQA